MISIYLAVIILLLLLLISDTQKQRRKLERFLAVLSSPGLAQRSKDQAQLLEDTSLKGLIVKAAGSLDAKSLTLILPTHKRHHHLCRALDYYREWNVRAIVIDSTPEPFEAPVPKSVKYVHCPELAFGEKIRLAVEQVETPYVLLSADDDFISPIAVKRAIKHMEDHTACACVQGWHAGFSTRKKVEMKWLSMHLFAKELQIDEEKASDRILRQCAGYMNCFYALHRTEVLKNFFSSVCPLLPKDILQRRPELLEISQAINTVAHGGHATLPMLWIAREMIVDSAGANAQVHNAKVDPAVAAEEESEVFLNLADSLGSLLLNVEPRQILQEALTNYIVFRGDWARHIYPHFGPVENVVFTPDDAALIHQVDEVVGRHPLSQT